MPYTDQGLAHAGSAELLFSGMYDEPAGTLARTIPGRQAGSTTINAYTTGGQVAVRLIPLPAGLIVTNIQLVFGGTAASGPTHFWIALTDLVLNVLAVSADQLTAAQTNATPIKLPMGSPYMVPQTGAYYIATSSTATVTAPNLTGFSVAGGLPGMAPILCGTAGNQTTPPAVGSQINGGIITAGATTDFAAWIS